MSELVTGAWLETHAHGERRFLKIGDVPLESGEVLEDVVIAYQSWGELNSNKDNVILVNHALTGWSDVPGWWPSMVGPGLPLIQISILLSVPMLLVDVRDQPGHHQLHLMASDTDRAFHP